ncbi:MAG: rsbU 2 [Phycisphaerales bacterium]|nr:rsbU 2 [Phycisphaerales bacterium]
MNPDELSTNARIAGLTRMTRELQQSRTPSQTLRTIRRGLADMYGPTDSLMLSTRGLPSGEYRVIEFPARDAGPLEDADPWAPGDLPVHQGGVIAEIIKTHEPQILQGVDWSADPFFHDSLAGYNSVAAVPLAGDHLPMSWVILLRRSPSFFTADDLEQTALRAALIGSLLESQMLTEEVADAHVQIDREVQRVGQIQRELLPDPLPQIPGLQIAASYETFGEAGGDLYDFIPLRAARSDERERWAFFIGDASGHGPSAAVVIAIVQALLHAHPPGVTSPAALLQHVNEHLCRRPIDSSFVTAFIGVYEPSSRRLTFACAGHPPPLLKGALARAVKCINSTCGYPLGIDAQQTFQEASVDLDRGDAILLYTDGILEARDPGGAMFGIERIEAVARRCSCASHEIVQTLRQAVTAHENGRRATDDQTLVALNVI